MIEREAPLDTGIPLTGGPREARRRASRSQCAIGQAPTLCPGATGWPPGAGVAGSVVIPFFYVTSTVGLIFVLTAFIVVVLGGMGSLWGALVGALIIGVVESLTEIFYSPAIKQIGSLVIFLLVLYVRPEGLFVQRPERY